MALHKGLLKGGFHLPDCEKHFHDHDETWLIVAGTGDGYWIDHDGRREDFALEAGDVWMIPAGYEHGSVGPNSEDFTVAPFGGTMAPGCQPPGPLLHGAGRLRSQPRVAQDADGPVWRGKLSAPGHGFRVVIRRHEHASVQSRARPGAGVV